MQIINIIFYLLLIDSLGAVIISFFFQKEYKKNMTRWFLKHFPATKGWSLYYLTLVIYIGWLTGIFNF